LDAGKGTVKLNTLLDPNTEWVQEAIEETSDSSSSEIEPNEADERYFLYIQEQMVLKKFGNRDLEQAIRNLPDLQRFTLMLRLDGASYSEMAKRIGISRVKAVLSFLGALHSLRTDGHIHEQDSSLN
jgi:DNA-directed RNA polymerase specialized sigma24 family protein